MGGLQREKPNEANDEWIPEVNAQVVQFQ